MHRPTEWRTGATFRLLLLVLAAVGLGVLLLWTLGSDSGVQVDSPSTASPADATASNLPVTLSSCERRGDSLRADGYVRNTGGVVVRYVQVELTWGDESGEPLGTQVTYAIGGEVFTPGDSTDFSAVTGDPRATDCAAALFDYEPL